MSVDPTTRETATLFGNDAALNAVRSAHESGAGRQVAYPAGAVLALVTWGQRDDPHWFGARIPDAPRSVEFLEVASGALPAKYRKFAGAGLPEVAADGDAAAKRTRFLLNLDPVELP